MFILKPSICVSVLSISMKENYWILRIFEFMDNINVLSQVSLLFEVENLAMASPATVSRCGMVYNDYTDLGWKPFVQSWLDKRHKVESTHNKWTGNLI